MQELSSESATIHKPSRREVLRGVVDLAAASAATYYAPEAIVRLSDALTNTPEPLDGSRAKLIPTREIALDHGTVRFLGVTHCLDTYVTHRAEFAQQIPESSLVMLEYFGSSWFEQSRPSVPEAYFLQPVPIFQDTEKFFQATARLCAQEGKDIIVVNPQNHPSQYVESLLTAGIAAGLTADEALRRIWDKFSQQKMDRRTFLRFGAAATAATVVSSWVGLTRAARSALEDAGVWGSELSETEKANALAVCIHDWRDISTANGLRKADQKYADEFADGRVLGIHGHGHNGVIEYLQNDVLRTTKALAYTHYNLVGENTIRRYSYNKKSNQWSLVDKTAY